jgi:chromosome segregation protein
LESDRVELQKLQAERSAFAFDEEKRAMREDDLRMRMREAGWEYDAVLKTAAALIRAGGNLPPGQIPETETRILRLRREVSLIGEIDPEVVKEYGILKERSEFLEQQREDLEGALDDWEALNRSLEEKITQGFQNALTHIDREFNRYFGVIFGGGKASLRLERIERPGSSSENGDTNPSAESAHPADFGIDFSVHLPRKKLHTLEALSGGEKALTAIALLLAIIAYGQPPFVVLDEIDAALDETNSGRIAQLLAELADRVQLILITHNRSVMTASRALYGITMDDGVSKVFSLRFADAEALATRDVHDPLPTAGV